MSDIRKQEKAKETKNKWNLNLSRTQTYQQEKLEKTQKDGKDTKSRIVFNRMKAYSRKMSTLILSPDI